MRARERELERKVLQLTDQMIQYALSAGLLEGTDKVRHLEEAAQTVTEMAEAVLQVLQGRDEHLEALVRQVVAQKLPDRRILNGFADFTRDLETIIDQGLRLFRQRQAGESGTGYSASMPEANRPSSPAEGYEQSTTDVGCGCGANPEQEHQAAGDQQGWAAALVPDAALDAALVGLPAATPFVAPGAAMPAPGPVMADADVVASNLQKIYPGEQVIRGHLFHGNLLDYYLPGAKIGLQLVGIGATIRRPARLEYYCMQEGVVIHQVGREAAQNPRTLAHRMKDS